MKTCRRMWILFCESPVAMNYRFALMHETFFGLRLDPRDLTRLLSLCDAVVSDPAAALDAIRDPASRAHLAREPWLDRAREAHDLSVDHNFRWTHVGEPDYPVAWYDLSCRPMLMTYRGDAIWRDWALLSVVGSRTPSFDTCRWMERELPELLRRVPVGVVSGGARGVDHLAHRLALGAGRPTVCVLPSGLCDPYPPGREAWWREFVERGGCLLSTFAPRSAMRKHHFAIRNRWIAGLAPITFVVEANQRSGSHLTARLAADEDRTVCTLPVSANAAQGLANLQLIADGHVMVRDAADLELLITRKMLGPGAAKGIQTREQEETVDEPHRDAGG